MKSSFKRNLVITAALFVLFILFTAAVQMVDVRAIGPEGSRVGFAALNQRMLTLCGAHPAWDQITDGLMLIAVLTALGFAGLGLLQLIRRKSLRRVHPRILLMACHYGFVAVSYLFFEIWTVNRRPVLVDGVLEASYPSSHTLLIVCIMGAAMLFFRKLGHEKAALRRVLLIGSALVIAVSVVGRMLSGMHWFTDIVGALLLGAAWLKLHDTLASRAERQI